MFRRIYIKGNMSKNKYSKFDTENIWINNCEIVSNKVEILKTKFVLKPNFSACLKISASSFPNMELEKKL